MKTVAVLASGPSLTEADIDTLRAHKIPLIAVNSTVFIVPDAMACVAGDHRWWKAHHDKVPPHMLRVSRARKAERDFGAKCMRTRVKSCYNSGMVAVEWAIRKKYQKIILLGADCSLENGVHHFGKHEATPNPNAGRIKIWPNQWRSLRQAYPKANVLNCSRHTELDVFPITSLEVALCPEHT